MINLIRSYVASIIAGIVLLAFGVFIGTYLGWYNSVPHIDKLFHFSGGFIVAWFFSIYLNKELGGISTFKRLIILTAMAALIGTLWEFAEFLSPRINAGNTLILKYFYGGDLTDTIGDLVADLTGGAIFALLPFRRK